MELDLDVNKLIQAVEERPTLYVQSNRRDGDWQLERRRRWQEVAEIVLAEEVQPEQITIQHINALKKKWISLRDQFVKACKSRGKFGSGEPGKKKSKYIYYERLTFLAHHVKNGDMSFTCSPPRDDEDYAGMIEQLAQTSDDESAKINISDEEEEEKAQHVEEVTQPKIKIKSIRRKRPKNSQVTPATVQEYAVPVEVPYNIPVQEPFPLNVQEVQPPNREIKQPEKLVNQPVGQSASTTSEQVESIVTATARGLASILNKNSIPTMKKIEIDNDPFGHKTFLMSCLPFFNGMSPTQILKVRAKIITAIEEVSAHTSASEMTVTTARKRTDLPPPDNQGFEEITIEEHHSMSDRKWHENVTID